ncbi:MAG TPA: diguanylate cyclase [Candidatus Baltobacteraceae bacterium]|nr:diguanylate cyclase [Candidatus Baltobacteraceae bacterium]
MMERQSPRRRRGAGTIGAIAVTGVLLVQVAALVMLSDAATTTMHLAAIATSVAAILVVGALYFALVRPGAARWEALVRRLEQQRESFRSMFDYHPDAIAVIDASGRIVRANVELERLTLYRVEELIGAPLESLAPVPDEIEHAGIAQSLFSDVPMRFDAALRARNGASVMVRVDTVPMRVGDVLEGVFVIARDVTRERQLEFRERLQRERLRSLARIASVHAGSVDRQISETLQYAVRALEMQGGGVSRVRADQVQIVHAVGNGVTVGMTWPFAESFTRHIYGTNKVLAFAGDGNDEWAGDPAQLRFGWRAFIVATAFADGVPVGGIAFTSMRARTLPFEEADLDFVRVVSAMIGASLAREQREEELEEIAYVDPVTRLPNRRYVMDQLRMAIARAERSGEQVIMYFIDLDGFKAVNDAFGHAIGDQFLAITAGRLRAILREGDVLARAGGDEFVALQMATSGDTGALRLGERLIEAASERVVFDGAGVTVGASVGIAIYPLHARTAEELLERADQAMYASKRAGKGVATLCGV